MKRLMILWLLCWTVLASAVEFEGKQSKWNGFKKVSFQTDDRSSYVVLPERPMAGNPWVLRARFPNWHTEMDVMLLKKGYVIGHIDVANLYGSPKAVKHWDAFYNFMISKGMAKKVVLEGVSRGGLISYNWAKKNPHKVACMYLEAPVCDIKSWPGGKGTGKGSPADWKRAQQAYGLDEAGLMAWKDNPIDNLEALAKAKVPVYHAIGLQDKIVPADENSFVLMKRYIDLGGPYTAHPMTIGKQNLEGHHFPIEKPEKIVDFIISHSAPSKKKEWFTLRDGLENARMVFERTGKGRVAFLGGSITYNPGWRPMVCAELKRRFPNTKFEFIAAGIPSTGSTPGAFRLVRDVFKNGPVDLLFEEAAVNDESNRPDNLEQVRGMEGIIRHARELNPNIDIVMMHFVDPRKIKAYNQGKVPQVIQNHDSIAAHYNIPSINLALEVTDRINAGEFTWKDDFKNLHPSPFGQKLYFNTINRLFTAAWPGKPAEDDKITAYKLPSKLDKFCYNKGQLFAPDKATLLKGFKVDPKWKNTVGGGTRPGFVNVPMLIGEKPGDSFQLKFKGSAVGIFIAAGKDAGTIEYRVDGGKWKKQDLFTKWSGYLHIPWLYTLEAELDDKPHTLEVKISADKNQKSKGHACRIVNFAVNGVVK